MAKKRGNSEGSIYKTSTGLWRACYIVHTASGIKRKYLSGKLRKQVSEKLTKAMADRNNGLVFEAGTVTVEEYLKRWLTDSMRETVRQSTYASYERMVNNHLVPSVGHVKLSKLKPGDLRRLYREKLDSGLSTRTVRYTHTIAKKALKDAVRMEMLPRNPADAVDPPKLAQEEMHPMSAKQVKALLAAASERLAAFYTVAVHTGMRPGELLALRWDDIDLEGSPATARVNRSRSTTSHAHSRETCAAPGSRRRSGSTIFGTRAPRCYSPATSIRSTSRRC
jgi:integrase